ncbi:MAG: hypothetical protein M0P43_10090 [Arcobacteraceae bacterium]|nr:hypothetical protein [Arcobacteraceae bacterium]
MESRTVLIDKEPASTNKVLVCCSSCKNLTTTYEYKALVTLNMSALLCRSCGVPLTNLEELSKKHLKRLEYHKS